jgi:hypothetical protein
VVFQTVFSQLEKPWNKKNVATQQAKKVEFKNLDIKTQMMSKYDVPWSRECKDDPTKTCGKDLKKKNFV